MAANDDPSSAGSSSGGKQQQGQPVKKSYIGEALSYYYNSVRSMAKAFNGPVKLQEQADCWLLGTYFRGGEATPQRVMEQARRVAFFSYRNRIDPPLVNGATHDAGWGCMHRTGQMMLCHALRRMQAKEDRTRCVAAVGGSSGNLAGGGGGGGNSSFGRLESGQQNGPGNLPPPRMELLMMFRDQPDAPFGLHTLVEEGAKHGTAPGQWFGPTALCRTLEQLVPRARGVSSRMSVVVGYDGVVDRSELQKRLGDEQKAVLLLLPLMLGMSFVAATNIPPLLRMLELPSSAGVVGGKPRASLYFVGHQGDTMFFLDPHIVQPAFVSPDTAHKIVTGATMGSTAVASIDPCLVLAFFFEGPAEEVEWETQMAEILSLSEFPIFTIIADRRKSAGDLTAHVGDCCFDDDEDL